MIIQALVEISTPIRDQIIIFFAFAVLSSSPTEIIYIIPEITSASTAKTATYLIPSAMAFHKKAKKSLFFILGCTYPVISDLQPGSPLHTTHGATVLADTEV